MLEGLALIVVRKLVVEVLEAVVVAIGVLVPVPLGGAPRVPVGFLLVVVVGVVHLLGLVDVAEVGPLVAPPLLAVALPVGVVGLDLVVRPLLLQRPDDPRPVQRVLRTAQHRLLLGVGQARPLQDEPAPDDVREEVAVPLGPRGCCLCGSWLHLGAVAVGAALRPRRSVPRVYILVVRGRRRTPVVIVLAPARSPALRVPAPRAPVLPAPAVPLALLVEHLLPVRLVALFGVLEPHQRARHAQVDLLLPERPGAHRLLAVPSQAEEVLVEVLGHLRDGRPADHLSDAPEQILDPKVGFEEPVIEPLDEVPGFAALRGEQPDDMRCSEVPLVLLQAVSVPAALSLEVIEGVRVLVPCEEPVCLRHGAL